jgi:uncharacterized cupredoxin-like copper-binding protein
MKSFSILAGAAAILIAASAIVWATPGSPGQKHRVFAAGEPGDSKKSARTIEISMNETADAKMRYAPALIEVKRGEQIRFVLKNVGKADHEFMLDTLANNAKHKAAMRENPDMEHDDPNGARLAPGATNEILWRFTKAGTFEFACLIPGHYESGMHGTVTVK